MVDLSCVRNVEAPSDVKVSVAKGRGFPWRSKMASGIQLHAAGWMYWLGGEVDGVKSAEDWLADFLSADGGMATNESVFDAVRSLLARAAGSFAFILEGPGWAVAAVDRVRSFPLFYGTGREGVVIGNDWRKVRFGIEAYARDQDSELEFLMSGYCTGAHTLYAGVQQLQAGEWMFAEYGKNVTCQRYFLLHPDSVFALTEDELIAQHHVAVQGTFDRIFEGVRDRRVLVPLSGGLDSRLVLGELVKRGHRNLLCFSYGISDLWEVDAARRAAEFVGVPWIHILYNRRDIRQRFHSESLQEYMKYASGGCVVPTVVDYYALEKLFEHGLAAPGDVVINGQSGDFLTGGHTPVHLLDTQSNVERKQWLQEYIAKHFALWRELLTPENFSVVGHRVDEVFAAVPGRRGWPVSPGEAAICYYLVEWQERQCKYVVNGQRVYDWLGLDWRLPLWSEELILFWRNVPWTWWVDQRLYRRYLEKHDPAGLFSREFGRPRENCPSWLKVAYWLAVLFAKVSGGSGEWFKKGVVDYFGAKGPFYPHQSFWAYSKDAANHRNYVSFYAQLMLGKLP